MKYYLPEHGETAEDARQLPKCISLLAEMRSAAVELAGYASYAEIVGAVSHNRAVVRKWCDEVFRLNRAIEDAEEANDKLSGGVDVRSDAGTAAAASDVIHQRDAPHTGAQQCSDCGGWFLSARRFYVNNHGPMCQRCLTKSEANTLLSVAWERKEAEGTNQHKEAKQ